MRLQKHFSPVVARLTVTKQVIRYRRCHRYFAKNAPSSIGMRPNYTLRNDYLGHDVLQFLISKQIRPIVPIWIFINMTNKHIDA